MQKRYLIIASILISAVLQVDAIDDSSFGACLPGQESCSQCYLTLKQSLLERDDNIRNLSNAFYPPKANIPEFVTVTYKFGNNIEPKIWYWSHDSSYLFFQLTTFQFLSLFFSKPAALFSQSVDLTLNESCANSSDLQLLTQRLKNFIGKKSFNPSIDENYFARSNIDTIDFIRQDTAIYILVFYIAGFITIIVITIALLWITYISYRWDGKLIMASPRKDANKYTQSKVFSAAGTSCIVTLYTWTLDVCAVIFLKDKPQILQKKDLDENILPILALGFDSFLIVVWMFMWFLTIISWLLKDRNTFLKEREYMFLAFSAASSVLTFVVHLPFIAIAYLNDASNATSIFIYYTVVIFIVFRTLDLSYSTCQGALIYSKSIQERRSLNNQGEGEEQNRENEGDENEDTPYYCFCGCPKEEKHIKCCAAFGIPAFTLLILVLIGMVTAALVVIPISKAFTDAPNRLLGFYQTAFVLIGAYLLYREFIKRKPSFERAVKDRPEHVKPDGDADEWKHLSNDGKLDEFYSRFVDIIATYKPRD